VSSVEVNEILQSKDELLTSIYFKLQKYYERKYGKDTVVLMEIGTFFEVYEVDNEKLQIGKSKEIAELLNIQLTRKNKNILENSVENPLMAGVPAISFEKHLSRIIAEEKYTVVVVKQRGTPPKVQRYIDAIISPGTNFEYVTKQEENYVTSLTIDCNKGIYSVGYSAVDVTTGKCSFNEVHGTSEDKSYALDEAFNYMNMHKTSEIVLKFDDKKIDEKEVIEYLELQEKTYHVSTFNPKISYQNELFKSIFQIQSLLSPIEYLDMERFLLASKSLAILIDFIIEHDASIVQKLSYPQKLDIGRFIYLGNNAVEQLNIIQTPHNPSVIKLINECQTAMGKRLLKERLTHPIKDETELKRRYTLTKKLFDKHRPIDAQLSNIYDIERLTRRIKLRRIHPFEINYLYDSLHAIKEIVGFIEEFNFLKPPCKQIDILNFTQTIESTFVLEQSGKYLLKDIATNIFKKDINAQIDDLCDKNTMLLGKLEEIRRHITSFMSQGDANFVSIERLEKDGFFISMTKNRFNLIKDELLKSHLSIDDELLLLKNFNYKTLTNSVKITHPFIDSISDAYVHNLQKIIKLNKKVFSDKMAEFEFKYTKLLDEIIAFIAEIDLTVSNVKVAKKYNYVCPEIVPREDENFLEIIGLRHLIIEADEEAGVYVPNDIILGDLEKSRKKFANNVIVENAPINKMHGVLLYGINSSGKSSLMKSVGIAVILAQAGFFVPAQSMRYSLFDSLFTRIRGNDNIARGLSSFAVEMLEMKNIFNRASKHSIILGDEISHSTETTSGVSIVASAILKLAKQQSLFLFATHLHQIPQIEQIQKLKNIICLHLSVMYSQQDDKLIFDRKLAYGSGSSVYGLEFAKSLHMDKEFLDTAEKIRKKLTDDYNDVERISKQKRSRYNKNLYVSTCAICGDAVDDVHHIKEQCSADDEGFIDHYSKDHKYNLIPLCKKHHKMVHEGKITVNGFITTSKGIELHYEFKKDT
jgi:DNA mismatch repair protein MutS